MINIAHISKYFKITQPGEGVFGKIGRWFAPQHKIIKAVDDISFEINQGDIVGYLGPNGAGKSTTIKLLTGVLYPTEGSVEVNGLVPYRNRKKNAYNIGVVYGQRSQLWYDLPLNDSFEILAAMYRLESGRWKKTLDTLTELLDMRDFLTQPVRELSLGQRMKGDIAASLLHEPPILYLDEPTIGLDVVSKNRILEFLQDMNSEKKTTIILTTHNLSDVAQVCPRIMIIDRGRVILDARQTDIIKRFGRQRQLIVEYDADSIREPALPEGKVIRTDGNKIWIEFDRERVSAFDLIQKLGNDSGIKDITIQEPNIETIVADIYEHGIGEAQDE